mmetsp:Transcript_37593/g.107873  ORF Transcript_37593/g.107873 Transcript_37593/m.107873 type:complete len:261 (-) Transcript_37593:369-1151(-)
MAARLKIAAAASSSTAFGSVTSTSNGTTVATAAASPSSLPGFSGASASASVLLDGLQRSGLLSKPNGTRAPLAMTTGTPRLWAVFTKWAAPSPKPKRARPSPELLPLPGPGTTRMRPPRGQHLSSTSHKQADKVAAMDAATYKYLCAACTPSDSVDRSSSQCFRHAHTALEDHVKSSTCTRTPHLEKSREGTQPQAMMWPYMRRTAHPARTTGIGARALHTARLHQSACTRACTADSANSAARPLCEARASSEAAPPQAN